MAHYHKNTQIQETLIQTFYAGESIFITGGTGFLGKILVEKLLRSCPKISKIYIMTRSKKNKSATNRLNEIFESPLFDRVREQTPDFRDKVVPIVQDGELNEKDLGLTKYDVDLLIRKISIVFHLAATVRFNEHIKVATLINVYATCGLLNLAKRMRNLKSFVHVSTISTNCFDKYIDESFYNYPIDPEEFIRLMRNSAEDRLDKKILRAATHWPNSYAFTKAMAEILIRDCKDLPAGIFRPSIVSNTAREPIVGWTDNYYGAMGVLAPYSKGLLRVLNGRYDCPMNVVPVDITINALIASAWDIFNQSDRRNEKMLIYNSVSTNDALLTYGDYIDHLTINSRKYPTESCFWLPTLTLITNKFLYMICVWLFHTLPALFIEIIQKFTGGRQRVWYLYGKIHDYCAEINYFLLHNWTYADGNIQALWRRMSKEDQVLFNFDMKDFNWPKYLEDHYKGARHYLLKEDSSTLGVSRVKWRRLYWIHQITKIVSLFVGVTFVWRLFTNIFL